MSLRKTVHLLLVADLQASRFLPNEPNSWCADGGTYVQVQNLYFRWPKGEMFSNLCTLEPKREFWMLLGTNGVVENRRY